MTLRLSREQVLAFRLASHHLDRRLSESSMLTAAGACGLQNSPPGTAALALRARAEGFQPDSLQQALVEEKSLLQLWSLRASPYIVPTADLGVFSAGLLPRSETELLAFLPGVQAALDMVAISAEQILRHAGQGLLEVLSGRAMTKDQLGQSLSAFIRPRLSKTQQETWQQPSVYAPDQHLGESIARFFLPALSLEGKLCHAERVGSLAYYRLTEEWLGPSVETVSGEQARAELVRRYLHCYGPSDASHFARWAGIAGEQARQAFDLVAQELVLSPDGHGRVLAADQECLVAPPHPAGVRMLPPHDPFLAQPDRLTLLPDKALHRRVWRTSGNPGMALVGGLPAALWRANKKGKRLSVQLEPLVELSPPSRADLEVEIGALLPFWSCQAVEVTFKQVI